MSTSFILLNHPLTSPRVLAHNSELCLQHHKGTLSVWDSMLSFSIWEHRLDISRTYVHSMLKHRRNSNAQLCLEPKISAKKCLRGRMVSEIEPKQIATKTGLEPQAYCVAIHYVTPHLTRNFIINSIEMELSAYGVPLQCPISSNS